MVPAVNMPGNQSWITKRPQNNLIGLSTILAFASVWFHQPFKAGQRGPNLFSLASLWTVNKTNHHLEMLGGWLRQICKKLPTTNCCSGWISSPSQNNKNQFPTGTLVATNKKPHIKNEGKASFSGIELWLQRRDLFTTTHLLKVGLPALWWSTKKLYMAALLGIRQHWTMEVKWLDWMLSRTRQWRTVCFV